MPQDTVHHRQYQLFTGRLNNNEQPGNPDERADGQGGGPGGGRDHRRLSVRSGRHVGKVVVRAIGGSRRGHANGSGCGRSFGPTHPEAERAREPLGGLLGPDDLDHRYPGFFVGAGLGVLLTAVSFAWCSDDDNSCDSGRVLPLGVLMTGVLGLSGAVIGGFLPKS